MLFRELFCNCAAPITAMRAKTLVAKPLRHKMRPEVAHSKCRSPFIGLVRESVARNIRDHYIEGVLGAPAKCSRVGEKRNQLYESVKRIWISVRKNEREWRRSFAAF